MITTPAAESPPWRYLAGFALVARGVLGLVSLPVYWVAVASYPVGYPLWTLSVAPILLLISALLGVMAGLGLLRWERWGPAVARFYAVAIIVAGIAYLASQVVGSIEVANLAGAVLGPTFLSAGGVVEIALGAFLLWALRSRGTG